jgi:UDP-3-O-[3-hydroxymyristoyl] glucosamine N-acyltransferase
MSYTIEEIAREVGGTAAGNTGMSVSGCAEPADCNAEQLALAMKPAFAKALPEGKARAAMLWADADWQELGLEAAILVPRPRVAMAGLTAMMDPGQGYPRGVDASAMVDPSAKLGRDVTIGPMAYVGPDVEIGDGTVIGPQCYFGMGSTIGPDSFLHATARIMARVRIGARFVAQPGSVIGSDGLSFVTPEESTVEQARATLGEEVTAQGQSWIRIHSLGSVVIGDDVEIGSNSCVDSGTIRPTQIGNGCKIDNLCHVAHNVRIGNDCLFAALVGVAGSTTVGNNVILGGQVGVTDNTSIGDNVVAGGGTKILNKIPAGRVILGYPGIKMDTHLEIYKAQRRLPRLLQDIAELQKAVFKTGQKD